MLEKLQEKLDQYYIPTHLILEMKKCKTDEELLCAARKVVSFMDAADEITAELQKVILANK